LAFSKTVLHKKLFLSSRKYDPDIHPGSGSWFLPILDPGSRGQKGIGSPDPGSATLSKYRSYWKTLRSDQKIFHKKKLLNGQASKVKTFLIVDLSVASCSRRGVGPCDVGPWGWTGVTACWMGAAVSGWMFRGWSDCRGVLSLPPSSLLVTLASFCLEAGVQFLK
jgi:hypothetical protein